MKPKLTKNLPQIRCSEETRNQFDRMCDENKRTLSNILQIITEDVANRYKDGGKFLFLENNKN